MYEKCGMKIRACRVVWYCEMGEKKYIEVVWLYAVAIPLRDVPGGNEEGETKKDMLKCESLMSGSCFKTCNVLKVKVKDQDQEKSRISAAVAEVL